MRSLPVLLILFILNTTVCGQQPFEGEIEYLLTSKDTTIRAKINAWFRGEQIRVELRPLKPVADTGKLELMILDFKEGKLNRIKKEETLVEQETLTGPVRKQDLPVLRRTAEKSSVLGHEVVLYESSEFTKQETKDSAVVTTTARISIWYAPGLTFPVPDSMQRVQMVPLFSNGFIALGSEIAVESGKVSLRLHTEAKFIRPGKVDAALFRYPEEYRVEQND